MREIQDKRIREQRAIEFKLEELWDWISSEIGYDEKGYEIQAGIKEFIKIKEDRLLNQSADK